MSPVACQLRRCVALPVTRVRLRARFEEHPHDVSVADGGRLVQRRVAAALAVIHARAGLDEASQQRDVGAAGHRRVQRRIGVGVVRDRVDVGAAREQQVDHRALAEVAGKVQRRPAIGGVGVAQRAVRIEQRAHAVGVAGRGRLEDVEDRAACA